MDYKKISKIMSYALRHKPEKLGIDVDKGGWTNMDKLVRALQDHFPDITYQIVVDVIQSNDKQRFTLSSNRDRVRAAQGHSLDVDLGYSTTRPPDRLFHGTSSNNYIGIMKHGINKGTRHHVHLSPDFETAKTVGSRKGKPLVLTIATNAMYADGYKFFKSDNGVWLTDFIPTQYIESAS